ncbi:MAG: DUF6962 family protein, partial [Longimicrobiales bacterium]
MNPILTEVTTGATDAVLGVLAVACALALAGARSNAPFRTHVWLAVFALLTVASALGAVAHGLDLGPDVRETLWQPLYLSLGLMLGLIAVAAVADGWGDTTGRKVLPFAIGVGLVFYGVTVVADGVFLVFVAYEVVAMLFALGVYAKLAVEGKPGAAMVAGGVLVTLVAAGVQQSDLSVTIVWPFDHNGIFHLVQIPGLLLMTAGMRQRLSAAGEEGASTA